MNYYSLLLPLAYLTLLIGSLATFSSLYRRRQAAKAASLAPWFPPHLQRNVYLSLLELQSNPTATSDAAATSDATSATASTKIPDSLLKAALFRRAVEDIHRLIQLRTQKPALAQLLARGSVGDELMQRLNMAEKEMELEIKDVVAEANALAPQQQWGTIIFQNASEAAHREMLNKKLASLESGRAAVKEEWERRRDAVKEGFLKELDGETAGDAGAGATSAGAVDVVEAKDRKGSSDEDAPVIVESGGPDAETGPGTPSGGGSMKKKKKGKK